MPVNPDELLIFKMRGMKTVQKKAQPAGEVRKEGTAMPEAAAIQVPAPKMEARPERRLFAPKEKPVPTPRMPIEQPAPEEIKLEAPSPAEEERVREIETLEKMVEVREEPESPYVRSAMERATPNAFARISGALFLLDALVFGYFIFPQSVFVISYIARTGFSSFLLNWSYGYGTSLVNLILTLLSAVSGALMLSNLKRSHMLSGATGSILLLAVSFEYLNSNATYLLLVSVITFISVVSLAYARMSAVGAIEREEEEIPKEISWPRIETF